MHPSHHCSQWLLVHHHLIRKGMRGQVGIIVEAGDAWEVHHFACLIAFGATAINPYLALSSIRDLKETGEITNGPDRRSTQEKLISKL